MERGRVRRPRNGNTNIQGFLLACRPQQPEGQKENKRVQGKKEKKLTPFTD